MQNINKIMSIISSIYEEECFYNEGALTSELYVELINLLIELKEFVK